MASCQVHVIAINQKAGFKNMKDAEDYKNILKHLFVLLVNKLSYKCIYIFAIRLYYHAGENIMGKQLMIYF